MKYMSKIWRADQWVRQKGLCHYCQGQLQKAGTNSKRAATVEHLLPISRGGKSSEENCVLACRECNNERGDGVNTTLKFSALVPK